MALIQNNPGSAGFSDNAPPASTFRNGPGTRGPTNERKSTALRVNRSFHGGNSANPSKQICTCSKQTPFGGWYIEG